MLTEKLALFSGLTICFSSSDNTSSCEHITSTILRNKHKQHFFEKYNFENQKKKKSKNQNKNTSLFITEGSVKLSIFPLVTFNY